MRRTITALGMAGLVCVSLLAAPVPSVGAACTYRYDEFGFPRWSSSCNSTVSPGRFGPLRMGKTTVSAARSKGYLAKNRMCGGRLDGVSAYDNWRRRDGTVMVWTDSRDGSTTDKGLRASAPLKEAKRAYPRLVLTGYLKNPYAAGQGWDIYSVQSKRGWLDLYYYPGNRKANFFAVRSAAWVKPVTSWSLDGC